MTDRYTTCTYKRTLMNQTRALNKKRETKSKDAFLLGQVLHCPDETFEFLLSFLFFVLCHLYHCFDVLTVLETATVALAQTAILRLLNIFE